MGFAAAVATRATKAVVIFMMEGIFNGEFSVISKRRWLLRLLLEDSGSNGEADLMLMQWVERVWKLWLLYIDSSNSQRHDITWCLWDGVDAVLPFHYLGLFLREHAKFPRFSGSHQDENIG